jgi:choline monooxygenase
LLDVTDASPTLPAEWYVDAARYQRERLNIFATEWLWFASEAEVATPSTYVAQTYAGWPMMVVRGSDGMLRGFHNVCSHRAGSLVDDGAGACTNLVCQYHGWAYSADGRLRSARDFGETLDPDEFALHAVQVCVWRGQVFVNLSAEPPPLEEDLSDFFAEMREYPLEGMTLVRSTSHDLACNWKTYADNYLEGYHIPLLHPELNRQFDAKQYHVELGDKYCRHTAPSRDGNPADGRWLFRWPNLAMNIYGNAMNVEVIVPTGPESCTVLYRHFFVDPTAGDVAEVIELADTVMEQDRRMVELVQRNLAAGTYLGGLLSPRHENGVRQFQDLVRAASA